MICAGASLGAAYLGHGPQNVIAVDIGSAGAHGQYFGGLPVSATGALSHDSDRSQFFDQTLSAAHIRVDDASLHSFPGVNYTVEFWAKFVNFAGGNKGIFCKRVSAAGPYEYAIWANNTNLWFESYTSAGVSVYLGNWIIPDAGWHHYVFTATGPNGLSYLDGNLVTQNAKSAFAQVDTDGPVIIGMGGNPGQTHWANGWIDEVAIYSGALSADQVYRHWSSKEIGRTNLCVWASAYQFVWTLTNITQSVPGSAPNPFGLSGVSADARKIEETATSGNHEMTQAITVAANTEYTASIYVRQDVRQQLMIQMDIGGSGVKARGNTSSGLLETSSAYGSGVLTGAAFTAERNSYFRLSVSGVAAPTGTAMTLTVRLVKAGAESYAGTAGEGLYVYAAQVETGPVPTVFIATSSTTRLLISYKDEVLTDTPVSYWRLNEQTPVTIDGWALQPFSAQVGGVDVRRWLRTETLTVEDTLGQPATAEFQLVTPLTAPIVGQPVRFTYYDFVIFGGSITHVKMDTVDLQTILYTCECADWSQILVRRKLRRNFVNMPIQTILGSILDNELIGEPIAMGTIDSPATFTLVDSTNARVFDVCRDMAGATGQAFYVDFDTATIQMRSLTMGSAPFEFSEANVLLDGSTIDIDQETYRNVQTVIVKGTAAGSDEELVVTSQRTNAVQIAERAAIEGGTGIYEEVEEVTHPNSNDAITLALLGIGYANLRLATSGAFRITVRCRTRGWGFRAGQFATVTLPTFGLVGTYIIQRVTLREAASTMLFYDIELTVSSLQQRAYESWLAIVKAGKVIVQMPSAVTTNTASFTATGAGSWVVPGGVTSVEVTVYGASGGGGGAGHYINLNELCQNHNTGAFYGGGASDGASGGRGGSSGKAVTVLSVVPGETLTLFVGTAGSLGANQGRDHNVDKYDSVGTVRTAQGTSGSDGTASSVTFRGVVVCQGDGGKGGTYGKQTHTRSNPLLYGLFKTAGVAGAAGSGIGDAVSVGGGETGGAGANGHPVASAVGGSDGRVEVRW